MLSNFLCVGIVEAEQTYRHVEDMGMCGIDTKYLSVELTEGTPVDASYWELGYLVGSLDGLPRQWLTRQEFEKATIRTTPNNTVTQGQVDRFIRGVEVSTIGDKTTLVRAILVNGFEIIKSSSCVDAANYDEAIGKDICMRLIKNEVWYLLGFMLQCAIQGIK